MHLCNLKTRTMNYTPCIGSVIITDAQYKHGRPWPRIAEEFIKMGKDRGYEVVIKYGGKEDGKDYICGYYVQIPQLDAQQFLQDVFVDDDSYFDEAIEWFSKMLEKL